LAELVMALAIEGERRWSLGIASLALESAAVSLLLVLPPHHRDPFDRMLVCQAIHHEITLVTSDEQVARDPVRILGAG